MKDKDYLRYLEVIEMHMVDLLPDVDPKSLTLYESMKYSLTAGGKRLVVVDELYLAAQLIG